MFLRQQEASIIHTDGAAQVIAEEQDVINARIAKEAADKEYRQGLSDYVSGRRETDAALGYVAYWGEQAKNEADATVASSLLNKL